jgi:hypothetical protein
MRDLADSEVRALNYGTMGGLQVPSDSLIAGLGPRMG